MHAAFPCFTQDLQRIMRVGANTADIPDILEAAGGTLMASGMAMLLKLGFGYVMRDSLLDKSRAQKALTFFNDNFVFDDPNAHNGTRYYQGKFLIRTRKPGDNMNVYLQFCPKPDDLFVDTPFGRCLNSLAVINTDVLTEKQAEQLANDPTQVDLVICFKDIPAILDLIGRPELDMVGLLLENVVQLTGNVGHLFKLGAIAKETELTLGMTA